MKPVSLRLAWAARQVLREPGAHLLTAVALALTVAFAGTGLLLAGEVGQSARAAIDAGPSLVVRCVSAAGGFAAMEAAQVERVRAVPGALDVRGRVFGTARVGERAVVLVGQPSLPEVSSIRSAAHAVAGPGLGLAGGALVVAEGPAASVPVEIITVADPGPGLGAHDVLEVPLGTARLALGLAPGMFSDLTLRVHHESEEEAIAPDVAEAVGAPVSIETRAQARRRYTARAATRGSLLVLTLVPALLALVLLVLAGAREQSGRAREVGLLKTMGWTSRDVLRLQLWRAALVGAPAVGLGAAMAWATVFGPWVRWPAALLFGWEGSAPALQGDPAGAWLVLAEVGAVVLVPWIVATVWPAAASATRDPLDLVQGGEL